MNLFFLALIGFLLIIQARLAGDRIRREMARDLPATASASADERYQIAAITQDSTVHDRTL
jgi:hypothetical protein